VSIKLKFEHSSIQMQAVLKDDALVELLTFITKHKSDEATPPAPAFPPAFDPHWNSAYAAGAQRIEKPKEWLAGHSPAEIFNKIKWDTNPEKILLMGAYHEAKTETDSWRSADMETRFVEAKDNRPSNFPRDIGSAIKSGFITTVTPRTYIVSRTGWNKIADAIATLPH
jgi:hypothetical protein